MAAYVRFLISYLHSQLFVTPALPTQDFTGQTIIVTGASSGLGLEAVRHFVRLKASLVILAVRDVKKGEQAKESIVSTESSHRAGDISTCMEVWELELANYESVKAFAKRVETLDRVDKVVENAGIYPTTFQTAAAVVGGGSTDEMSVAVNVVGTFLLALLLLPKLRAVADLTGITPTISVTGSFVHWLTMFPERNDKDGIFVALADREKANIADRYNVTKLLQLYTVRELASLLTASNTRPLVIINISNPGFCRSNIMREATGLWLFFIESFKVVMSRTTEVGSRTLVAGAEGGLETHGQYLNDCHPDRVAPIVDGDEGKVTQKRVWEELSRKLELIQPGILRNIYRASV